MVQLDLKKLSKGMHIKDKMKLLFEDMNRQAETAGKESILTPQERDAIIADARKTGEITEIRRINELYKTVMLVSIDMEIVQLGLYLAISHLEKTLMGVMLKGTTEEIINQMIFDFVSQEKKTVTEIDKKVNELRIKYRVDSVLFKGFDFFNPPLENNSFFSSDLKSAVREPNLDIQKSFIVSLYHARKLKKKLYEISYVLKKAPIDFLPESTKKLIKESQELLSIFTNLDSSLRPLRIYRDFGLLLSNNAKPSEPKFFEIIQDINKSVELNTEEKEILEVGIDRSLKEDL